MSTILLTGGTGTIGEALSAALVKRGYEVIILTRNPAGRPLQEHIRYAAWDINKQQIDLPALQQADHIIHLAGAGVMEHRWTAAYRKEIQESRTKSSQLIFDTLRNHSHAVKTFVSASAIGWYGSDKPDPKSKALHWFTEEEESDPGFLGETCRLWEESVAPAKALGIRLVKFRIGIVLSNSGGALAEFKKPVGMGIAAILGSGKQVVSWIHIEDLCRLFIEGFINKDFDGPYNAVAPEPVTNKTLTLDLAKALRGRFFIPMHVPAFVLKLFLGQKSLEILKSTTVSCGKIKERGFTFLYPTIEAALVQLIRKEEKTK